MATFNNSQKKEHSVLFVCSANQCRSPMAEVLFADLVKQNGKKVVDWRIASAGVWAYSGMPATTTAIATMQARGLDLKAHRSKSVSESLLAQYNLILCMTFDHKKSLQRNFPAQAEKVYLLSEMMDVDEEIDDPVGRSAEVYRSTANEMLEILQKGYKRIFELS